ncbi:MAG: hotdog fold thioesterase [Ferruginibacter sp.]|nr:hotdog fold thioesterase [Ferruginibacter sp.]
MESKSIWFNKDISIADIQQFTPATMAGHLGMEWVAIGPDFLTVRMPVDERTRQPYGLLHGGASCALAETVGSIASHLRIDPAKFLCVGLEINANHVRSARQGFVTATAKPLHLGSSTHVWDIRITDEADKLVCISRLTVAILEKKG